MVATQRTGRVKVRRANSEASARVVKRHVRAALVAVGRAVDVLPELHPRRAIVLEDTHVAKGAAVDVLVIIRRRIIRERAVRIVVGRADRDARADTAWVVKNRTTWAPGCLTASRCL